MKRSAFFYLIADIVIVTASFLLFIWIKPASRRIYLPQYFEPFLVFLLLWVSVSLTIDKYRLKKKETIQDYLFPVIAGDTIILAAMLSLMFLLQYFSYSRLIVFGTFFLSFFTEVVLASALYYNRKLNRNAERYDAFLEANRLARESLLSSDKPTGIRPQPQTPYNPSFDKELRMSDTSDKVYQFLRDYISIYQDQALVISTSARENIETLPGQHYRAIINLRKINDIKRLNKFFESVNSKLPGWGQFIACVTTNEVKKKHILAKYPWGLNYIYYAGYYVFKRIFPKVPVLKKFYFFVTNGYNRAISRAEALGRIYSCGFEILEERQVNGSLYIIARKFREPFYDLRPTYGPLIKLKRVGKGGRAIYVYKMRTMHPYAEYIQDYVYKKAKLQEGGKFGNDFRINSAGRLMRKLWLDELPMVFNLLKGDLKLFGVRPLSYHYFSLYDEELKQKRIRTRPGLIPPFYADLPKTLEQIQESENRYLEAYFEHPFLTDWKYFWKAFYNIIFLQARSK